MSESESIVAHDTGDEAPLELNSSGPMGEDVENDTPPPPQSLYQFTWMVRVNIGKLSGEFDVPAGTGPYDFYTEPDIQPVSTGFIVAMALGISPSQVRIKDVRHASGHGKSRVIFHLGFGESAPLDADIDITLDRRAI